MFGMFLLDVILSTPPLARRRMQCFAEVCWVADESAFRCNAMAWLLSAAANSAGTRMAAWILVGGGVVSSVCLAVKVAAGGVDVTAVCRFGALATVDVDGEGHLYEVAAVNGDIGVDVDHASTMDLGHLLMLSRTFLRILYAAACLAILGIVARSCSALLQLSPLASSFK